MLSLFSTAKPFVGHSAIIQRNALASWKRLHPDVEIILFGDEGGAAEICSEFGLRHEPEVERTPDGPPSVKYLFDRAQEISGNKILCYCNCDIILGQDFLQALQKSLNWTDRFLMVGRRWDTDITAPIDFAEPDWSEKVQQFALQKGFQRLYYNIDYFAFTRGVYTDVPPLAIGRRWWDQWAVWKAAKEKAAVIDASDVVIAVHQNHDYSSHPQGEKGIWFGDGSRRNMELAGGESHLHTIEDANYRLTKRGFEPNRLYWLAPTRRIVRERIANVRQYLRPRVWVPLMNATRPVRHALGLKQEAVTVSSWKSQKERLHPYDRGWSPSVKFDHKPRE